MNAGTENEASGRLPFHDELPSEFAALAGRLRACDPAADRPPPPDLAPAILARIPESAWRTCTETAFPRRSFCAARPVLRIAAGLALLLGFTWLGLRLYRGDDEAVVAGDAVSRGLYWLAEQQQADGGWDATALGGQPEYVAALDGLAVLAFARAPESSATTYRGALDRGADCLVRLQAPDGRLGPVCQGTMYNHGIATLALLEAYRATGRAELRPAITAALAFTRARQAPAGGWSYGGTGDAARPNTSISAWQIQALLLARELGWPDCLTSLRQGLTWMTGVMNGEGLFGYEQARQYPEGPATLTSMGSYCTLAASRGRIPLGKAVVARAEQGLAAVSQGKPTDYYDSYFRTAALSASPRADFGVRLDALRHALTVAQGLKGPNSGTWDPNDRWGRVGGRLYSTTMAVLSLTHEAATSAAPARL